MIAQQCHGATIRHIKCAHIIEKGSRCQKCTLYIKSLNSMCSRYRSCQSETSNRTAASSHINYRYLSTPEKIIRLQNLHKENRSTRKKLGNLERRIANAIADKGVPLEPELNSDLQQVMLDEEQSVLSQYPPGSFPYVFWKQQLEAASRKDSRGMRWHPAMIKWCLYLCHHSSSMYETIRQSGCIHVPSQRTLQDYANCVKSEVGFSTPVDRQLFEAANLATCPEYEKLVVLLLDEMYIREDLVYEKQTGKLIGFTNLGEINNHLLAFEHEVEADTTDDVEKLAKTMLVVMVKGLFSPLRYPYAQFLCASVSGDLLFNPFWQAVFRLERMGFIMYFYMYVQ